MNSRSPTSSSNSRIRCDSADGVMHSSSAAIAKEPCRAAASKAVSACTGGSLVVMKGGGSTLPANNLAGVYQVFRIERMLDGAHGIDRLLAVFLNQEIHFVQSDAMFAGAGAVHRNGARHHALVDRFGIGRFGRIVRVNQEQHVKIAVADMADDRIDSLALFVFFLGFLFVFCFVRFWFAV